MLKLVRTPDRRSREAALVVLRAEAQWAADRAARLAADASVWSARCGVGSDDAAEAALAAMRARQAAERAERDADLEAARAAAAAAKAALTSAEEADARVTAAIAEQLAAA